MQHQKRKAMGFIIGMLISKKTASSLYCYTEKKYSNYSGTTDGTINVFDYERGKYLTGTPNSIFDYASGKHIQVQLNNNNFNGYDYETQTHFSGQVNNGNISFYDYEDRKYYNFSI